MVEKLAVEIGLEGADDIDRQLEIIRNGFASLGRAAVPVAVAITTGLIAATKASISFAESITKINEQAMKLGQGIQQFDRMRQALEGAGVSAEKVTGFMQKLAATAEKAELGKVAQAAKELGDALSSGGFISGTSSLRNLTEAARGAGPAAVAARKEMEKLGLPIPAGAILSLEELTTKTGSADAGLAAFVAQLRQMSDPVQANKVAMDALGVSATQLITAYDGLGAKGVGAITPDMVANAESLTGAVNRLLAAWERFGSVSFSPLIVAQLNATTAAIQALQNMINSFSWSTFIDGAIAAGNALKALTIPGLVSKAVGEAGKKMGFASGGLLGGTGTGTSDSNLAWVSRGEHIMPARAVAQPGVLSFLEALRRSGGDLGRVLNGMGRFALGGMVPRMPAYAAGGLAGGSNVTIQFPGLPAIGGLRASSDVVDQLHKAAALAQVRSGGRKPSRYS